MKLAHDSTYIPDGFVYNNDRLSCIIVGYDNGNDLKAGSNAIQHWPFVWGTARFEYRFIPDRFAFRNSVVAYCVCGGMAQYSLLNGMTTIALASRINEISILIRPSISYIPDQFADNYDLECIIVGHDMGGTNGAGYATAKYWPYFWINLAVGFFLYTRWFLV